MSIFKGLSIGRLGLAALMVAGLAGCGGGSDSGTTTGTPTVPTAPDLTHLLAQVAPETCALCHTPGVDGAAPVARSGSMHQARYKEFYQDGVVKIVQGSMTFNATGTTATLAFQMTKNGANFDCRDADSIGSYWAGYDSATMSFPSDQSLKPAASGITYNAATNVCTFTQTVSAATATSMAGPGIVQIYGVDEILETDPVKHISSGKYPFAGVLKIGTVNYSSAANVTGCEGCHTQPFLKHTYIYGTVADNTTGAPTQFYTCKGCHYDQRNGGHVDWQILKDNPARYAEIAAGSAITDAEKAKYAYKAKLMNDVHMSHAMEFAYPQSMRNCVTCHAGKLDTVLADSKFKAETCISCHSVDGIKAKMTAANFNHASVVDNLNTVNCATCHTTGGAAPTFKTLHVGGYDPKIYSTAGVRYSDTFVVNIDSASVANNVLDIKFSATGTLGSLSAANITPTVLIGLYGYDSKDFIVAAHGTDADGKRNLEYVVGGNSRNPARIKTVSAANGMWEITADLSDWADKIAAGVVKRVEIAVLPELKDASGTVLGLNAPSKTFNLGANAFENYFSDIVKVFKTTGADGTTGCNTCHDQLATTFHSGIRGGNIKVCRICHEVSNGGSHLELQSRSIDSYVHAIHSFQAFDPGDINFGDPVESLEYQHHTGSSFPRFGILNCESCHNPGMYDVPKQGKSMPGVLSGTDTVAGRNIGAIAPAVTGPAVRACGGCHRAQAINADDSGKLATLLTHWRTFGYYTEVASADARALWEQAVDKIMSLFVVLD